MQNCWMLKDHHTYWVTVQTYPLIFHNTEVPTTANSKGTGMEKMETRTIFMYMFFFFVKPNRKKIEIASNYGVVNQGYDGHFA